MCSILQWNSAHIEVKFEDASLKGTRALVHGERVMDATVGIGLGGLGQALFS